MRSKEFGDLFLFSCFQFDRIDLPSISHAPIYKCLLGDSFFDRSYETSCRFINEVDLKTFIVNIHGRTAFKRYPISWDVRDEM